jgi:hypothetical protein
LYEFRVNSNFSRWLSFLGSNNAERKFSWSTSVERKLALVKQREKKVGLVKQREKKVGLGALVHPAKLQSVNGVKTRAHALTYLLGFLYLLFTFVGFRLLVFCHLLGF